MRDVLLPLKLTRSLSNQVAQLVKNVEAAHKELKILHSHNASLSQQSVDCIS